MTRRPVLRWGLRIAGLIVGVLVLAIAVLYLFPLGSSRLQHAQPETLSFSAATAAGRQAVQRDSADPQVLPECRTELLMHPDRTAKAVLMLHGYTGCPKDFTGLARLFYDRGYNVYVPRESHHGLKDVLASSKVSSSGLADYADTGLNIAAGLGDEVGVIGLSGGGVLATWLTEYRAETVTHLLALAPFYQPAPSQAPGIAIKPLIVLYGNHLLPDHQVGGTNFTFAGLAQYVRIVRNFRGDPVNSKLRSVAIAFSAKDPYIDRGLAVGIPAKIAKANGLHLQTHEFPAELNLPHNIVLPANLGSQGPDIDELYFKMYEG